MELLTQPNERRCNNGMVEAHILPLNPCCPWSGNPLAGSKITITYRPADLILEVASLRAYVDSYIGGKGEIRSMEGMIQAITQDCANAVRINCEVVAELIISPNQQMRLTCHAFPIKVTSPKEDTTP
jgi:NADPH-dependent 7-cyano-7-deazaguanine reductase QueF